MSLLESRTDRILRDHVLKRWAENLGPVAGWRTLPEIPTGAEINPNNLDVLNDASDLGVQVAEGNRLPNNTIDGPWSTKDAYIETHYKLLREDSVAPLREAVRAVKANPGMTDKGDVCIYTHVHVTGYTLTTQGPAARIQFSYERARKNIHWAQSKRLRPGTIVAITPERDMFRKVCKIAVVAARPIKGGVDQNPPEVDLFWGDVGDAEIDPAQAFVMVESRVGYYEANRHLLVAMQKLMTESFPLAEHIIQLDTNVGAPSYVNKQPLTNMCKLVTPDNAETGLASSAQEDLLGNVDIRGEWPVIANTGLDASQLDAVKRMMTKKVAIIQGPPGTGKTFVSISGLKVMLDNLGPRDPPVIVAAQTNHALDQLLLLLAPSIDNNFLRLGGRASKDKENEMVLRRTLFHLRRLPEARVDASSSRNCKRAMDNQGVTLEKSLDLAFKHDILKTDDLVEMGLLTKEQADSLDEEGWATASEFSTNDPLRDWLGGVGQLKESESKCPMTSAFAEEEYDDFEELEEQELESGLKDDDDSALNGRFIALREKYTGKCPTARMSPSQIRRLLDQTPDLHDIPERHRGEVYKWLQDQMKAKALEGFSEHAKYYMTSVRRHQVAKQSEHYQIVKKLGVKLIGCTTTGLSKYRALLAALQPRTMLIEEAAETLEGTITAAMFESLQHLILVGDHQQLQAHCNLTYLEKDPYNLSMSMFERLVNNGIGYTMLNTQRRMVPEIREILQPFYPTLQDHASVLDRVHNRPHVPGMDHNAFFFHHQWPESRNAETSRFNIDEAEMVVEFFVYLVLNNIDPSQITVLTFYNGQRSKILSMLKTHTDLQQYRQERPFKVVTVDSYQGEENDIILLSLVRSNTSQRIGFLENRNRAVVALSRARRGMYVFGNVKNLVFENVGGQRFARESFWTEVAEKFNAVNAVQDSLPITCVNHRNTTLVTEAGQWKGKGIHGGCLTKCTGNIEPCGHPCPYNCHPFPHDRIICKAQCPKRVEACGHQCVQTCGDRCRCAHRCVDIYLDVIQRRPSGAAEAVVTDLDDFLDDHDHHHPPSEPEPAERGSQEVQSHEPSVRGSRAPTDGPHAALYATLQSNAHTGRGGTVRGGTGRGGPVPRGPVRGGTVRGGTVRGGLVRGGPVRGGIVQGGTVRRNDRPRVPPLRNEAGSPQDTGPAAWQAFAENEADPRGPRVSTPRAAPEFPAEGFELNDGGWRQTKVVNGVRVTARESPNQVTVQQVAVPTPSSNAVATPVTASPAQVGRGRAVPASSHAVTSRSSGAHSATTVRPDTVVVQRANRRLDALGEPDIEALFEEHSLVNGETGSDSNYQPNIAVGQRDNRRRLAEPDIEALFEEHSLLNGETGDNANYTTSNSSRQGTSHGPSTPTAVGSAVNEVQASGMMACENQHLIQLAEVEDLISFD